MAGWLNSVSDQNNSDSASPHVSVSTWGLGLRRGGFATLTLGPAGWLALLSPGVVIGLLVARLSGGSFALFGIIGGLAIWFAAVSIERLFAGHRPMSFVVDPSLSAEELERVAEAARYAGITFDHHETFNHESAVEEPSPNLAEDERGPDVDNTRPDQAGSMFVTKTKYSARLANIIEIKRHAP